MYMLTLNAAETNNTFIFPGLNLGSEAQWGFLLGSPQPSSYGTQYVQDMVCEVVQSVPLYLPIHLSHDRH